MTWPLAGNLRTLLPALLLAVFPSPQAGAIATLDVVFTERNGAPIAATSSVEAVAGDQLTASLRLGAGPEGVSSYALSIVFDADLVDELDLRSAVETLPAGFDFNLDPGVGSTQESDASQRGEVFFFEAATFGFGPADASFEIGVIEFQVTGNVATDGMDIESGLFSFVDGIFDNLGGDLSGSTVFGSAAVNVPEPATGVLLALGLLGIRTAATPRLSRMR